MSIYRTNSIQGLEEKALRADVANNKSAAADDGFPLEEIIDTTIAFSQAFDEALKKYPEKDLQKHLLTVLPEGHKIPYIFNNVEPSL